MDKKMVNEQMNGNDDESLFGNVQVTWNDLVALWWESPFSCGFIWMLRVFKIVGECKGKGNEKQFCQVEIKSQLELPSEQRLLDSDQDWLELVTSPGLPHEDPEVPLPRPQPVSPLVGPVSGPRERLRCFFCRAREFWNQTWVTRLESPVKVAILSRSCPSGLESICKQ